MQNVITDEEEGDMAFDESFNDDSANGLGQNYEKLK